MIYGPEGVPGRFTATVLQPSSGSSHELRKIVRRRPLARIEVGALKALSGAVTKESEHEDH